MPFTKINTNVSAINANRNLSSNNTALSKTMEKLSSGFKINRAGDDPAGLIISEYLRRDISGLNQAIDNTSRGLNVLATAEAALDEMNRLLITMRDLSIEASNKGALSQEEIDANQAQIDNAIESINRIANTTSFGTLNLLNGNLDYSLSGVDINSVDDVKVTQAYFTSTAKTVDYEVTTAAEKAYLLMSTWDAALSSDQRVRVVGNRGTEVLTFADTATVAECVDAVNEVAANTGTYASVHTSGGTDFMSLYSEEWGDAAVVQIDDIDETPDNGFTTRPSWIDNGVDVEGIVNGVRAQGRGRTLKLNTSLLDMEITLAEPANSFEVATGTTGSFGIRGGGGAIFQMGKKTNPNEQINVGIQRISSDNLGKGGVGWLWEVATGGQYNLTFDSEQAVRIIDEAIKDVVTLRGRLGAVQMNSFETTINSLGIASENLSAAESSIRDTDFANATSKLTQQQILVSAGTSVLATANSIPQNVLSLLG